MHTPTQPHAEPEIIVHGCPDEVSDQVLTVILRYGETLLANLVLFHLQMKSM